MVAHDTGDIAAILARLDRLTIALEQLVQAHTRKLAQSDHEERRARDRTGPTTPGAREAVERKLRKKGLL